MTSRADDSRPGWAARVFRRRPAGQGPADPGSTWLRIATATLAVVLLTPILSVLGSLVIPSNGALEHIVETLLPVIALNTVVLVVGVGAGTALIGTWTAWLVTMYRFPGSRLLQWMLLLPLAMPSFIVGYAYTDALSFTGPVQTALRETFGWSKGDYWFPEIHSVGGAASMMALVLYPYVYYLARTAFLEQSVTALEVASTLGHGAAQRFFKVAVPLARPAIIAGMALAMMEAIADFGTVQYFGVDTLTTAIYKAWLGMGDRIAAGQLASLTLLLVAGLVLAERAARRQQRFDRSGRRDADVVAKHLAGARAWGATFCCVLPVVLGFLLPVALLVRLHVAGGEPFLSPRFLDLLWHSVALAATASVLLAGLAFVLAYGLRTTASRLDQGVIRLAALGYAVPGTVAAVALLPALGAVDALINRLAVGLAGFEVGLVLSGTVVALLLAYAVRFLAVALGSMEAGFSKIPPSLDHAARSLGCTPEDVLTRIHMPLLRRALLTAVVLVFTDVLKELPATLIVRPFNFDTLAVRVYQLASDERLEQASTGALVIVAAGLLPIILLTLSIGRDVRRS